MTEQDKLKVWLTEMLTHWNNDEVSVKESPPWGAGVPQYTNMSAPFYFCMPELLITTNGII